MFRKIRLVIKATRLYQKKRNAKTLPEQIVINLKINEFENKIANLFFNGKLSMKDVSAFKSILECGEIK